MHILRRLDAADARLHMGDDLLCRHRSALGLDHHGRHLLAPLFVRRADHGAFGDFRQLHHRVLDFRRKDVEAAGDDHVLLAVDDVEKAVLVALADVAGVVPAIHRRFGARVRQFKIAAADNAAATDDFADLAHGQNIAVIVHQLDAHRIGRLPATCKAFRVIASRRRRDDLRRQPRGDEVEFGLAVALAHAGPEHFDRLFQFLARHRRAGEQEVFEARIIIVAHFRMAEHGV